MPNEKPRLLDEPKIVYTLLPPLQHHQRLLGVGSLIAPNPVLGGVFVVVMELITEVGVPPWVLVFEMPCAAGPGPHPPVAIVTSPEPPHLHQLHPLPVFVVMWERAALRRWELY